MGIIGLNLNGNGNQEHKEPTIVLSLTLSKLWAVLVGIVALLAGSFTLGSYLTQVQVEKKDVELARLGAQVEGLQRTCPVSKAKVDFFALSSRLSYKRREAGMFPADKKLQNDVKDTQKQLALFLEENVNKKPDESGTAIISVAFDNRDSSDSKIQFRGELETYEVSKDVKRLTRNISWNNAPRENTPGLLKVLLRQQRDADEGLDLPRSRKMSLPVQRRTLKIRECYPVVPL